MQKNIKEFISKIHSWILKTRMRKNHCVIDYGTVVSSNTLLEGYNHIYKNTHIKNTTIGYATYIAAYSELNNCKIGKFCSIGAHVKIITGQHPSTTWVSTHPAFFSTRNQAGFHFAETKLFEENKVININGNSYSAVIGNDVWIGEDVSIIEGVTIGDGAIIAAGALVTKNVEAYTIIGGIPAQIIKKRFKDSEIEYLQKLKWWDKDVLWIAKNAEYFQNIETLMRIHSLGRERINE